jgi:hypothetical protein
MDGLLENTIKSVKKTIDDSDMEKINLIVSDYSPHI